MTTTQKYTSTMRPRKPKLGSIYQRGGVFWIKYYRNGRPYRESSGSEVYADAERLCKRRMGEIVTGKFAGLAVERIRMQSLFDDLLEDYRVNERTSIIQLRSRLKLHLVPAFGAIRVSEFSTNHVKNTSRTGCMPGLRTPQSTESWRLWSAP
jgi:hypothetical protein